MLQQASLRPKMKLINSSRRCSIIDVDPEDLASQLTLIDLPIFKAIQRDELLRSTTESPSRKNASSCPNVAAMKRQFNQVTFWVVGQVLAHDSPRHRAELISHLVKTAKCLYQLNNLHSSNAVVSALLSSPIYRLKRTWHYVNKKYPKDKNQFEKLSELYSDTNNYESLRKHLANCDLPCIPYLGMYSRDIIYINEAHQEGTIQRTKSTTKILHSIEKFQLSEYKNLSHLPDVHCCLMSSCYIEELQRFVEDANYRRSLELEPADKDFANSNSFSSEHHLSESPKLNHSSSSNSIVRQQNDQAHQKRSNVLTGFTSMVHSAVLSTSYKFVHNNSANSSRLESSVSPTKHARYLLDDSLLVGVQN